MSVAAILVAMAAASSPTSPAVTSYPPAVFAAAQPNTALDMVKLLPGFALDLGGGARGFAASAGNVLIDGARPATKDDGLDEILKRIPASSVARIEIIRGGAPGIDMQGKTVLANVIRRAGSGSTMVASASTTLVDDGRLGYGVRLEGARHAGPTRWEGSLLAGEGFDDGAGDGSRMQVTPAGGRLETAAETSRGAGSNYKLTGSVETPAAGGKLRVNATLFDNPYHYTQADLVDAPPGADLENDHDDQRSAELGVRYDRRLGAATRLETYLLQQFGERRYVADYAAPGDVEHFSLSKETAESIARTTLNIRLAPSLSLQTGGEGDFNWLLDHTGYLINGAPTSLPAANVRVTELRGEAFGVATWTITKRLTLEAGARLEISRLASVGDVVSGRSFLFPKPRAVLTWSPDKDDQVRLRVEREVGQLDFDDFAAGAAPLSNGAVRAGNPNLTPEQDWVVEAAYDRRFWGGADLGLTLRHYALTDAIDRIPIYAPSGTYDAPGNIGSGSKDEAAVDLSLPTDRLGLKRGTLTTRWTMRQSRVTDPTTGLVRSISGLHPNDGEIHFTQGLPKLKATWGFDVFNQWRETYYRFNEIDTDKLKTYATLFAEYKPRPDLAVRFELDNVGARAFRHVREVYADSRSISPLDYTDIRDLSGNRSFYLRVRKSFG